MLGVKRVNLWSEFQTNEKLEIHKWKHYFPIYERHFERFRNRTLTLIEIGVARGGSLQLWKRCLGPFAKIVGVDINPSCKKAEEDQIEIRIGSQNNPKFLQGIIDEFGAPDIVIDDGSHVMADIEASFQFLYPRMDKNGVYLVEDLHTAYWKEKGGGLEKPTSFIEKSKTLIDSLNADHSRGALPPSDFTKSTLSMHFYDSVIVFEKGQHVTKGDAVIGRKK